MTSFCLQIVTQTDRNRLIADYTKKLTVIYGWLDPVI